MNEVGIELLGQLKLSLYVQDKGLLEDENSEPR